MIKTLKERHGLTAPWGAEGLQSPEASSRSKAAGFTLVELLVVIAIIGLLAAVVVAAVSPARVKARDSRRIADVKSLQTAIELCKDTNNGNAPDTPLVITRTCGSGKTMQDHIAKIPTDPTSGAAYGYARAAGGKYYIRFYTEEATNLGPAAPGPTTGYCASSV